MKLLWKIVIGAAIVLVIGGGVYWRQRVSGRNQPKTHVVERRDVTQEVAFTGTLRAKRRAELAFETGGTLVALPFEVGDEVMAGQVLARLDARSANLELERATADLVAGSDKARLSWQSSVAAAAKTKQESVATLAAKRQSVRDAKVEMDQAKEVWQQTVRESGDESSAAKAKYAVFLTAQSAYRAAQTSLVSAQAATVKTNQTAVAAADETQAAYVATQQAARGVSGLSALQAAQQLTNLRVVKSVLVAPFSGVVTEVDAEEGEFTAAGSPVVTLETADQLEVTAQVPESDIAKLRVGTPASLTLDAFADGRPRSATIISSAPAAKVIEGVPTYEVMLEPTEVSGELKSGMTANVTVQAAKREQVVATPRRAVQRTGGVYKVKVRQADGSIREVEVELGVLGSDGLVEITKGLTGGETVVLPSP